MGQKSIKKREDAAVQVKLPDGQVVQLTQHELDGFRRSDFKITRKRCTFLPGVNPRYDAAMALKEEWQG